jgi:hypothetical protein
MQNSILHPAQQTRTTAQVVRRIGKRNIVITPSRLYRYKGTIGVLLSTYGCETGITRCRIWFCIQHNQVERQHKSLGESGKESSNRVPTSSTSLLVILLIICAGFEVNASDLDIHFSNFLLSYSILKSDEDHSIAVKNLYKLYKNEFSRSWYVIIYHKFWYPESIPKSNPHLWIVKQTKLKSMLI